MTDGGSFQELVAEIARFNAARDWKQFHSPKNLMLAMTGEVGELASELQWRSDDDVVRDLKSSPGYRDAISGEVADVFLYLVQLADSLGVDLIESATKKLRSNEERYPVDLARGNASKWDQLTSED